MGTWGVGIFSNDLAQDIRWEFRDLIAQGLSAPAATEQLLNDYQLGDEEVNDFWLALAAVQHRSGHVDIRAKARALEIALSTEEVERWQTADRGRRKKVLSALSLELESTPPPPKRFRKQKRVSTALLAGQHVIPSIADARVLLRIVDVSEDRGGQHPRAVALKWNGTERQLARAHRLRVIRGNFLTADRQEALAFVFIDNDPEGLRILDVTSDQKTPEIKGLRAHVTKWAELPRWFGPEGVRSTLAPRES